MAKTRSIFEEVGDRPRAAPAAPRRREPARRGIAIWLMILFALLVVMIVVGGMTRLTDSGLSITEWAPITGAIPPLSDADWQREFDLYRQIPQYELVNRGMTLDEFKVIYWWEWGHRQLGRLIGVVWAVGFLGFLLARRIPRGWTPKLLGLGVLGGIQGAIGWWMVASGLEGEMVRVASYRLAVHLGLAFVILGLIAWYVFTMLRPETDLLQARRQQVAPLVTLGGVLVGVTFVQIVLGALVAGIEAGRGYIDWPLMAGQFVPPNALGYEPVWRNFTENPGLVQFNHRMVGYALFLLGLVAWIRARRSVFGSVRAAFDAMMVMMVAQTGLGILTVIHAAPWQLAITHQLGAVVLFVLVLRARFQALYPARQRITG